MVSVKAQNSNKKLMVSVKAQTRCHNLHSPIIFLKFTEKETHSNGC